MAKIQGAREAQYPLTASFTFNFDDTMVDSTGVEKSFNVTGFPGHPVALRRDRGRR